MVPGSQGWETFPALKAAIVQEPALFQPRKEGSLLVERLQLHLPPEVPGRLVTMVRTGSSALTGALHLELLQHKAYLYTPGYSFIRSHVGESAWP